MFKKLWDKLKNKDEKQEDKLNQSTEETEKALPQEVEEEIEEEMQEEIEKEKAEEVKVSLEEVEEVEEVEVKEVEAKEVEESIMDKVVEKPQEEYHEITVEDEVAEEEPADLQEEPTQKISLFKRLKEGLSKTKNGITGKIDDLVKSYQKIDEELFEELEEILITADIGVNTTMEVIDELRDAAKQEKVKEPQELKALLKKKLADILDELDETKLNVEPSPAIILVVGVNGVGKTTSIGKIAHKLKGEGKKVILAAGDTFRAAAIDQLKIWGDRVGVDVIKHQEGSDPAAVVYDAIQAARARKTDVLICDTAGRLHNKKNLMNELGKVFKVVEREYPQATREVLLVLDATTGQNAVQQAKTFKEVANISGLVLTKLDGTAKGGIVIAISRELNVPVKLIGVGEAMEDLQEFSPQDFVEALFGEE